MSRVAVLSDIHGNLLALEAVTADAEAQGCTMFVNLGDIVSGPLWPSETADWLMARDWPTIAGNHERQVLTLPADQIGATDALARAALEEKHLRWMAALPATLTLADMLLCHGTPGDDHAHLLETIEPDGIRPASEAEVRERLNGAPDATVLCGHSHIPRLMEGAGQRVINPGSVGLQAFVDDRPYPYRVEMNDPWARYAIVDAGAVVFRSVDYDHLRAARQAERLGRADWAAAIATGRVS